MSARSGAERGRLVALRARALEGDREAADLLFSALQGPVRRAVAYRLGARAELKAWQDDLTQDTLMHLWTALAECRAEDDVHLLAWARAAGKNCARGWLRRELPRCLSQSGIEPDAMADVCGESEPWPALQRELVTLSQEAQEALYRRLVGRQEWREVAVALATTPAGARRRYQRAVGRLRRRLCPPETTPPDSSR